MENEGFQLEQQVAGIQKGLARLNEKLNLLLSLQNTGTKAVVAVPNCGMDQEDDVEDATLYFCLYSLVKMTATWFAVPPPGGVDSEGYLSPVFEQPRGEFVVFSPFALGSYIFLVSDPILLHHPTVWRNKKKHRKPYRDVHYLDTQNVTKGWKVASTLEEKPGSVCHFLVANDKIYAFEFYEDCSSLAVSFLACQQPNRWVKVYDASVVGTGPCCMINILASTIEYADTTVDGKPGKHAQRALIIADYCRLTFDFDTKSCVFINDHLFCPNAFGEGICLDGGVIYFLSTNSAGHVVLMAYNYTDGVQCRTQVFGLVKYLPIYDMDGRTFPQLSLVRLGNHRLCLVWARLDYSTADADHVRCTKFSVEVLKGGVYCATNVSSQEYKVRGSFSYELEAVVLNKQQNDFDRRKCTWSSCKF